MAKTKFHSVTEKMTKIPNITLKMLDSKFLKVVKDWKCQGGICGCEICGKTREDGVQLQAHHTLSKSYYTDCRYNKFVILQLCAKCHILLHKREIYFFLWTKEHKPHNYKFIIDNLDSGHRTISKEERVKLFVDIEDWSMKINGAYEQPKKYSRCKIWQKENFAK